MIRSVSYATSFVVYLIFSLVVACNSLFSQSIGFDCPAIASANSIYETDSSRAIEIPIACSTTTNDARLQLTKIRTEVCWNRMAYPLTDYVPRTVLQSNIDGAIQVEERSESNLSFNSSLADGYLTAFGIPGLNGEASRKKSTSRKYNQIPQHELVLSSGPIKRGTGAFFEFRPSLTESLEGGRNLVVAFEVPVSWRAGILQITCHATGNRKRMGIFNDGIDFERIFIVPVYLKGDDQAFRAATALAKSEQQLRSETRRQQNQSSSGSQSWFGGFGSTDKDAISDYWMHHLIQSGSDRALRTVEGQLSERILIAANRFDQARDELLALAR